MSDAARQARAGFPERKGGKRKVEARARLARALWDARGERRLPSQRELDEALRGIAPDELDWVCELSPLAPLYFLPTRELVRTLAKTLRGLGVTRVLEVAAGDGFLARSLARLAPELEVHACDSGAWRAPEARMTRAEKRALAGVVVPGLALGTNVERCTSARAIRKHAPELVLAAWLPPGNMVDALVRANVQYVLELGAGSGITGSAYSWRFAHEFLEGPLEQRARCRLDARPEQALHSRATLYYGRAHTSYYQERVRPGDWLYQFRPASVRSR